LLAHRPPELDDRRGRQARLAGARLGLELLELRLALLDQPVAHLQLEAHVLAAIARERRRVADEVAALLEAVVVDVPLELALLGIEALLALAEHLAPPVLVGADGVVAQREADGEHPPPLELYVVAARRDQVDRNALVLPALDLAPGPLGGG